MDVVSNIRLDKYQSICMRLHTKPRAWGRLELVRTAWEWVRDWGIHHSRAETNHTHLRYSLTYGTGTLGT